MNADIRNENLGFKQSGLKMILTQRFNSVKLSGITPCNSVVKGFQFIKELLKGAKAQCHNGSPGSSVNRFFFVFPFFHCKFEITLAAFARS